MILTVRRTTWTTLQELRGSGFSVTRGRSLAHAIMRGRSKGVLGGPHRPRPLGPAASRPSTARASLPEPVENGCVRKTAKHSSFLKTLVCFKSVTHDHTLACGLRLSACVRSAFGWASVCPVHVWGGVVHGARWCVRCHSSVAVRSVRARAGLSAAITR